MYKYFEPIPDTLKGWFTIQQLISNDEFSNSEVICLSKPYSYDYKYAPLFMAHNSIVDAEDYFNERETIISDLQEDSTIDGFDVDIFTGFDFYNTIYRHNSNKPNSNT